jgi:endonuclease/exonuclease/phosphatase family metal-dependent hydrolase
MLGHMTPRSLRRGLLLALTPALLAAPAAADAASGKRQHEPVSVMTRNVYLGADLTPGVQAADLQGLVNAAGVILKQVDDNVFATRAKGLAAEIKGKKPDLVGLQEAALWRTGPCTESPIPPKATTVRYDYVKLLLTQLNKGAKRYRVVISQPEFDFEVYANTDGDQNTAAPGCPLGSELNGRLTMRDVILARVGGKSKVKTSKAKAGHFDTLLRVKPAGVTVDVTRGWTAVDATVGKSAKFRFVNTHLEAFDNQASNHTSKETDVGNGQIREIQAKELFASGGPATGKLPVILLGDLNSDTKTEVKPGDGLAYAALTGAGFVERATSNPLGCCLNANVLTETGGGSAADFDHKVDHVMTNKPNRVKLKSSAVTGLFPVNGFWSSDHAGIFSSLTLKR